jgi:hypothetical protein
LVKVDTSKYAIGGVLVQHNDEGREHPVVDASRALREAKIKYFTTEKECLSLVEWVKLWRPYLYGRKFTVQTDHKSLIWVFKQQYSSERLLRWVLFLQDYDMVIEHKPERKHGDADSISRMPLVIQPDSLTGGGHLTYKKQQFRKSLIHYVEESIPLEEMYKDWRRCTRSR